MALRLTPQNALSTARQLSQDLTRWLDDAGNIGPAPRFRETLNALQDALASGWLGADISGSTSSIDEMLASAALTVERIDTNLRRVPFTRRDGGLLLRNVDISQPPADRAGSLSSPIILISSTEGGLTPETIDSYLLDRPLAIWLGSPVEAESWRSEPWTLECARSAVELSMTSFGRLLAAPGDPLFDALLTYSVVASLDSLSTGLDLALEGELRGLKAKKALIQQRVTQSQQRTGPGSSTLEFVGELRGRIQRHFSEFERGLNDRSQQIFLPQIGTVSRLVESKLVAIQDLENGKQGGKTSLAVSAEVEGALLSAIRLEIENELSQDLVAMRDMFRLVQTDIETYLERRGAPPVVPQFQYLTDDRVRRLLDNTMIVQRRYSGEMKKGGLFEYAMASRRYLSLMLMALSSFGLLSYFRRSPVIMLPVTFFVLIIGGLIAVNAARREQVETSEKEIEKARELLRGEFKRMFSDVQRGWSSILSQHLGEQLQATLSRAEISIRDSQGRQSTEAADEKQRIQRQLQNLETTEKRLLMAAKGRDLVGKAISQSRGELKQLILSLFKQQPARTSV